MNDAPLPWSVLAPRRAFALAHLAGDAAAVALHGGRGPGDAEVVRAAGERRAAPLPHRADLAAAVEGFQRDLGAPNAAVVAARRLADAATVVVIGGQQPGVAAGPHLGWSKAMSVLALAARLEAAGAGPVVPMWWVASEDHDVDEARAVWVARGKTGAGLLGGADPADRRMLARIPAPGLEDLVGPARDGEFDADVLPAFAPPVGADLGRATAATFAHLLGGRGLVVVEPHVVRPFAREVFALDVNEPGVLAAAVGAGNARVRAAGFEPVLPDRDGPLHFRIDAEGRRTRGGGTAEDLDDLAGRLSADVALRVLVQDAALPTVAQVSGPTEFEYVAAFLPARERLGGFTPVPVLRSGVTFLESRVAEALADLGSDARSLLADGPGVLEVDLPEEAPFAASTRGVLEVLRRAAADTEPHNAAVRSRLQRAEKALDDLAAASDRALREERGVGASRRRKVLDELLPDGGPQERRWSLLPYLLRHGPELLDAMAEACADAMPGHRILETP